MGTHQLVWSADAIDCGSGDHRQPRAGEANDRRTRDGVDWSAAGADGVAGGRPDSRESRAAAGQSDEHRVDERSGYGGSWFARVEESVEKRHRWSD